MSSTCPMASSLTPIKKESPNEGTETPVVVTVHSTLSFHKKRIPE